MRLHPASRQRSMYIYMYQARINKCGGMFGAKLWGMHNHRIKTKGQQRIYMAAGLSIFFEAKGPCTPLPVRQWLK